MFYAKDSPDIKEFGGARCLLRGSEKFDLSMTGANEGLVDMNKLERSAVVFEVREHISASGQVHGGLASQRRISLVLSTWRVCAARLPQQEPPPGPPTAM